jgi:hypothetical protein
LSGSEIHNGPPLDGKVDLMQRQSFITLALMAATLGVAGCHAEQQPSPQKAQSAPASDYTAWWKTEGSPAEAAGKAIAAATQALPGWA